MSTRSDIIVQRTDGKFARIYCHWDGYLEHNGAILQEHYNSQARAEELVKEGDLSSLQPKCSKPKGHSFDKPVKGFCIYYGRDRGEKNVETKIFDSLAAAWPPEDTWTEFTYVWAKDYGWLVADADTGTQALVPLADALAGKNRPQPPIKFPAAGLILGRHK